MDETKDQPIEVVGYEYITVGLFRQVYRLLQNGTRQRVQVASLLRFADSKDGVGRRQHRTIYRVPWQFVLLNSNFGGLLFILFFLLSAGTLAWGSSAYTQGPGIILLPLLVFLIGLPIALLGMFLLIFVLNLLIAPFSSYHYLFDANGLTRKSWFKTLRVPYSALTLTILRAYSGNRFGGGRGPCVCIEGPNRRWVAGFSLSDPASYECLGFIAKKLRTCSDKEK